MRPFALAVLAVLLAAPTARAEEPAGLPSVDAESPRSPRRLLETPLPISVVEREELRAAPAVDLSEALDLVPGVSAQSSRNFAQDTRVAIRGSGARASFGIRGVRLLIDGIPSTLPDGQSEVDSLDLAFIDRIEVIRSNAGSLYGGSSGGTIAISTLAPTPEPALRLRTLFGSDHLFRQEATVTGSAGGTGYVAGLAHTSYAGYRDHGRGRQTNLMTKFERELADGTDVRLLFSSVWGPEAQDPGGLRQNEVDADRRAAAPNNRTFDAGEKLDQQKVGVQIAHPFGASRDAPGELRFSTYWLTRDFRNALPIPPSPTALGRVDLERSVAGASVVATQRFGPVQWLAGVDVDIQHDLRKRYQNVNGARGPLGFDQSETVRAVGPFAQLDLTLARNLHLILGGRYDWTEFLVGDRYQGDGGQDDSGRIRFREFSPRVGLHFGPSPAFQAYANLMSGFDVPTTTEMTPVNGSGGFDTTLEPERTVGVEAGVKGLIGESLFYDIGLFDFRVRNALVPFEQGGRTFFRNAAKLRRRGAELGLSVVLGRGFSFRSSYTYSDYRYTDYYRGGISFGGNREPNIAEHRASGELRWDHPTGLFATLAVRHASALEVDDANTAESESYTVSDARIGWLYSFGRVELQPFAGVRNWSGAEYDGTIRPNASFGRYFEPAPETELYGGLELRLR